MCSIQMMATPAPRRRRIVSTSSCDLVLGRGRRRSRRAAAAAAGGQRPRQLEPLALEQRQARRRGRSPCGEQARHARAPPRTARGPARSPVAAAEDAAPTRTFSNTVMPSNGRGTWYVRRCRRGTARAARRVVMSRPSKTTRPPSGRRPPVIRLSTVVLPAPFGPTIPSASPLAEREGELVDDPSDPNASRRLQLEQRGHQRPRCAHAWRSAELPGAGMLAGRLVADDRRGRTGTSVPFVHWPPTSGVLATFGTGPAAPVHRARRSCRGSWP